MLRDTVSRRLLDGERATNLFRVRWVDDPEARGTGPYPRFEQIDHERRWVENRRLISLIGGSGGGNFDVWKINAEDAENVAERLGVELDSPTAGRIGEIKEDEDAR